MPACTIEDVTSLAIVPKVGLRPSQHLVRPLEDTGQAGSGGVREDALRGGACDRWIIARLFGDPFSMSGSVSHDRCGHDPN